MKNKTIAKISEFTVLACVYKQGGKQFGTKSAGFVWNHTVFNTGYTCIQV